jgi:hypothetical protein
MAGVTHKHSLRVRPTWIGVLLVLCPITPTVLAAETVQSLRYGTSLYYFYQQDYFNALTELMAGQQLDALGAHTEGAEMLRGGMSLSYGMDRQATAIFEDQLATAPDSVNANQAWFYLGKMAWQRDEPARTLQALSRMAPDYSGPLQQQATYLQASADLRQGDADQAAGQWQAMPEDSMWRQHLGYHLGANRAAQEDWTAANQYFADVTDSEPETPEAFALADKAFTAAGYAYLASGDFEQSSQAFRNVRLSGPYTTRALLGYGWSAAEQGDYLAALGPWEELAKSSLLDESARESLLAVPYAYDRLDRPGMALEKYQFASTQYAEALAGLEEAVDAFREEPLGPLLGIEEEGSADWLFDQDILPNSDHSPYLQHLVTRHGFQVALRELRDLYSVAGHLARAQQRLRVLQEVDTHQQAVWASITEDDRRNTLARRQQQLATNQQALKEKLQSAIEQHDARLLAEPEQTARWSRLERATTIAQNIDQSEKFTHRLRFLRGLLIWQDNEAFPIRAWQSRTSIKELDALAAESDRALQQVDAAIAAQQQSNFAPRIEQLADQVQGEADNVEATIHRSESQLRQVAIADLEQQAEQLARAMGQSQLAIAHLHDRALDGAGRE